MSATNTITLGLASIKTGAAAPGGTMPTTLTKFGKVYKDSCTLVQEGVEVTEHFEEGKTFPEVRKKQTKMPVLKFSIMDPDDTILGYCGLGGTAAGQLAVQVETSQGYKVNIPNGDVEAVVNAEFSAKGIMLIDFTITPLAVTAGSSIAFTTT